jgi:periplasmic copper chaperone A
LQKKALKMTRILLAIAIAALSFAAYATDVMLGELKIHHPWTYATPAGAKVGAGFMVLHNGGKEADQLVSASSPVAGKTEIHTHVREFGIMRMRAVDSIEIGGGQKVELKPGGFHIMFFELKQALKEGEKFPVTLEFKRGGKTTVQIEVEARGAHKHDHAGHKH